MASKIKMPSDVHNPGSRNRNPKKGTAGKGTGLKKGAKKVK